MKRVTISTIKAGEKVLAGYKDFRDANEFLGFTDRSERHSETPKFASFKEAKAAGMGDNAKEVEAIDTVADRDRGYGHHCYAGFRCLDDGSVWTSYVYNGRWSVGSSADPLKLEPSSAE